MTVFTASEILLLLLYLKSSLTIHVKKDSRPTGMVHATDVRTDLLGLAKSDEFSNVVSFSRITVRPML